MDKEILLLHEVAAMLRCSRPTVYRMIYSGELSAFRVRGSLRVRRSVVEAYQDLQTAKFQEEYPPADWK